MIPHSRIRSALRQIWWRYSPERSAAKKRARLARGLYQCEVCTHTTTKPEVDHKIPCGSTPGAKRAPEGTTWDGFIERLFCASEGLQVVCPDCHKQKGKAS